MIQTISKKLNKKGFTLAELLIVIAIIAVLVAIAIPVYTAQLNKANQAVDDANLRAACSMASADYQLNGKSKQVNYTADTTEFDVGTTAKGANMGIRESDKSWTKAGTLKSKANDALAMQIVVSDGGKIDSASWK